MNTDRELMQQALEALEFYYEQHGEESDAKVITALREKLAQPEQEPVATVESVATVVSESGNQEVTMSWWHEPALHVGTKLYTTPPQRKPLTDEEIDALALDDDGLPNSHLEFARAIEAKLREKNA